MPYIDCKYGVTKAYWPYIYKLIYIAFKLPITFIVFTGKLSTSCKLCLIQTFNMSFLDIASLLSQCHFPLFVEDGTIFYLYEFSWFSTTLVFLFSLAGSSSRNLFITHYLLKPPHILKMLVEIHSYI